MNSHMLTPLLILLPVFNLSAGFTPEKDECRSDLFITANSSSGGITRCYALSPSEKWVLEIQHYRLSGQSKDDSTCIYIFRYCYPPERIHITTFFPTEARSFCPYFAGYQTNDRIFFPTWSPGEDTVYFRIENSTLNSADNITEIFLINVADITSGNVAMVPEQFQSHLLKTANSPNPFSHSTTISYSIPKDGYVAISIYNAKGDLIRALVQKKQMKGSHTVTWDGKNNAGKPLAAGAYYYQTISGDMISSKTMLLLK